MPTQEAARNRPTTTTAAATKKETLSAFKSRVAQLKKHDALCINFEEYDRTLCVCVFVCPFTAFQKFDRISSPSLVAV